MITPFTLPTPARHPVRCLVAGTVSLTAMLAGSALVALPADAAIAPVCTVAPSSAHFAYTGGPQTFTVPDGVKRLTATLAGAAGGDFVIPETRIPPRFTGDDPTVLPARTIPGGAGIKFSSDQVYVHPGEEITVVVGGAGGTTTSNTGGGRGQGGGGLTALMTQNQTSLGDPFEDPYDALAVAGGGGGSSYSAPGGDARVDHISQTQSGGAGTSDSGGGAGGSWPQSVLVGPDGGPGDGAGVAPTATGGKGGHGPASFEGGAGGTLSGLPQYSGTTGGYGGGGGGGAGAYFGGGGGGGGGYYAGSGGAGGSANAGGTGGTSYYYEYANDVAPNDGDGFVTLTWTNPAPASVTTNFDTTGGSTAPASQTTDSGCAAATPAPPTRDGYAFQGWFTAPTDGTTWDFATPVTSDQTLYAQWIPDAAPTSDQTITVSSDAGSPHPGDTYTPAATSDSALPVSLSLAGTSSRVCHLTGPVVTFDAAGTCEIRYDQAGDSTHNAASQVTEQVAVTKAPSSVELSISPTSPVFGQQLTAHVTGADTASGDPLAGTLVVTVDGDALPATTSTNAGAANVPLTSASRDPLSAGTHQVEVTLTPTGVRNDVASTTSTLVIDPARTTTQLDVHTSTITATVTAAAQGAGTPTGQVTFHIGTDDVGTATLSNGVATLTHVVPAGAVRNVSAAYSGAGNWAPSAASTVRHDPTVLAQLSSGTPKTRSGWYRSPVTVRFSCTAHGAALTGNCPTPVRLTREAGGQSVSRTIRATDGGIDTVTVSEINIDRTAPALKASGVRNGATYAAHPAATCRATDAVSGVASCKLTRRVTARHGPATTYAYRAVAVDRAGNQRVVTGRYRLLTAVFEGAPFRHGAFNVRGGHAYTMVVNSATRPVYVDAAVFPRKPTKVDKGFRKAGHHRWVLGVTISDSMRRHRLWNVGVKISGRVHDVRIRVL
jgi:uncharacterized repeat protein (TIGR02543 family)